MDYFGARFYGNQLCRFTSVDPIWLTSARLVDPQQLNLYGYVRGNPLRYTDPTGKDFWLRGGKKETETCHAGYIGNWDKDHKIFTRAVVKSSDLADAKSGIKGTVTGGGVKITTATGTYSATFINGTQAANLQGSGALTGFSFNIAGQSGGNLLYGTYSYNGSPAEAAESMQHNGAWRYAVDMFNPFHKNSEQYRFSDPDNPDGPSTHLSLPLEFNFSLSRGYGVSMVAEPAKGGKAEGEFHVDEHGTISGHIKDVVEMFIK